MDSLKIIKNKVIGKDELAKRLQQWRSQGFSIVFTNGCFDLLHRGHVEYLAEAADKGDLLVVGLNTDASVKRLKGTHRPINGEEDRALLLAALSVVDAVVLFEDDTPYELIKAVRPDVLVKGADYRVEEIVGYDVVTAYGGRVETVPLTEGYSTTKTIVKAEQSEASY